MAKMAFIIQNSKILRLICKPGGCHPARPVLEFVLIIIPQKGFKIFRIDALARNPVRDKFINEIGRDFLPERENFHNSNRFGFSKGEGGQARPLVSYGRSHHGNSSSIEQEKSSGTKSVSA